MSSSPQNYNSENAPQTTRHETEATEVTQDRTTQIPATTADQQCSRPLFIPPAPVAPIETNTVPPLRPSLPRNGSISRSPSPSSAPTDQDIQDLPGFFWTLDDREVARNIAQDEVRAGIRDLRRYLASSDYVNNLIEALLDSDLQNRLFDALAPMIYRHLSVQLDGKLDEATRTLPGYSDCKIRSQIRESFNPHWAERPPPKVPSELGPPAPRYSEYLPQLHNSYRCEQTLEDRPRISNPNRMPRWNRPEPVPSRNLRENSYLRPKRPFHRELGPEEPGLEEIRPLNNAFSRVLSYRLYRLSNRNPDYSYDAAADISERVKRIKNSLHCPLFSGQEPLAVLQFLKNFTTACDETGTSEGIALHLMKHLLQSPARDMFSAYYQVGLDGGQPGLDSISSYPEAVQWLLLTYAQEGPLSQRYRMISQSQQEEGETETEYATRLRLETLKLGDVFSEANLITTYIEGLQDHARYILRNELNSNRRLSYTDAQNRAQGLGDTHRGINGIGKRENVPDRLTLRKRSITPPRNCAKPNTHALAIAASENTKDSPRSTNSTSMALIHNPYAADRDTSPMDSGHDYNIPRRDRSRSRTRDSNHPRCILCYV